MKTQEINIRDPYLLLHGGIYYLYGTRSESSWGPAYGFDCYFSSDRENWDGPVEIFHRPEGFFADREYWAPECYFHQGRFCLLTTLGAPDRPKGVYLLVSDSPTGPFVPCGGRLTPEGEAAIDGTLCFEDGAPWLVYSRSFENGTEGEMFAIRLADDLSRPAGEPVRLFSASEAPWARPVPFAKAEFGRDDPVYFTDGPCLIRGAAGELLMAWSSWGTQEYAVGVAVSDSGRIAGPWRQLERPLYPANGGHGMLFRDGDGQIYFVLHAPNDKYMERPHFLRVEMRDGGIRLADPE
jgi:hypothetical protein